MEPVPSRLRVMEKAPGVRGLAAARHFAKGDVLLALGGVPRVTERSRYSLQIGATLHLDRDGHDDDYLNHACSPNAFVAFPELDVCALRDIAVGDEVRINYCATEEELVEAFVCDCGSARCYGLVRGFRFLSRRQQRSLAATASPWLRARYGL